jgi:gamma-butyrobetaine dioxygenase
MNVSDEIAEVAALFAGAGMQEYGGEVVTVSAHMLQAAAQAERWGAPDNLVAAALLHDVGHCLPFSGDRHEDTGADWLARWFPPDVVSAVRLHVAAKRYLCAVEPAYAGTLSDASTQTLQLQGGPMTPEEARAFEQNPDAESAVAVRRWDDAAKDPDVSPPDFDHFRPLLERVLEDNAAHPLRGSENSPESEAEPSEDGASGNHGKT